MRASRVNGLLRFLSHHFLLRRAVRSRSTLPHLRFVDFQEIAWNSMRECARGVGRPSPKLPVRSGGEQSAARRPQCAVTRLVHGEINCELSLWWRHRPRRTRRGVGRGTDWNQEQEQTESKDRHSALASILRSIVSTVAWSLMTVTRSRMFLAYSATVWTPAAYRRFGLPGPPL